MNNAKLGHTFEDRVKKAFERNGYVFLEKNSWRKNYDFQEDPATKREYDLVLFNTAKRQFYIVECKAHQDSCLVGLEQVVEFSDKLRRYKGEHALNLMVTDTDYTPKAKTYASGRGIHLVDGATFEKFERKGSLGGLIKSFCYTKLAEGLMRELTI